LRSHELLLPPHYQQDTMYLKMLYIEADFYQLEELVQSLQELMQRVFTTNSSSASKTLKEEYKIVSQFEADSYLESGWIFHEQFSGGLATGCTGLGQSSYRVALWLNQHPPRCSVCRERMSYERFLQHVHMFQPSMIVVKRQQWIIQDDKKKQEKKKQQNQQALHTFFQHHHHQQQQQHTHEPPSYHTGWPSPIPSAAQRRHINNDVVHAADDGLGHDDDDEWFLHHRLPIPIRRSSETSEGGGLPPQYYDNEEDDGGNQAAHEDEEDGNTTRSTNITSSLNNHIVLEFDQSFG
jgi:hypothetical protein